MNIERLTFPEFFYSTYRPIIDYYWKIVNDKIKEIYLNVSSGFNILDEVSEKIPDDVFEKVFAWATEHSPEILANRFSVDGMETDHDQLVSIMKVIVAIGVQLTNFKEIGYPAFFLSPSLYEMLKETEVSDVPLEKLRMPHSRMYIEFPKQDIDIGEGEQAEGVFIFPTGANQPEGFHFIASGNGRRVVSAGMFMETLEYRSAETIRQAIDENMKTAHGPAAYEPLVSLIANTILYINSRPEDGLSRHPNRRRELERQAERKKPKKKAKLLQRAQKYTGISKVIIGMKYEGGDFSESNTGRRQRFHIVRGHWRFYKADRFSEEVKAKGKWIEPYFRGSKKPGTTRREYIVK